MKLEYINSKISRKKLHNRIYESCKITKTEKASKDSNVKFYNEAAKLLAIMHLSEKGEELHVKE